MKDETARRLVHGDHRFPTWSPGARRAVDIGAAEALGLLGSVSLGRVVFTHRALPAIRPVNHVLEDGDILIRTHDGAALIAHASQGGTGGVVVAFETDDIDPATHLGWSVVVTGYCHLVTDPETVARCGSRLLSWADGRMDHVVRIHPDLVTGVRLVASGPWR
ncbi:pyridoxamine 5'-phosphate oxidase family protein [Streptomyces sp. NPDC006668]|uniref:pyridoxamine 5'-phosphate oxidase family protein n=1 Tax=Streptomyces sp. NPDC006668 TaxID=3156903 RepID=UPI0033D59D53